MSKKGDDVKHLFAHLGLNPDDYRELNPVNESDDDEADTAAQAADDNWPHVDVEQEQPAPQDSAPVARDDAPEPDVEQDEAPAPVEPPEIRRAPPVVDAAPEHAPVTAREPESESDPGPERWSLLSRFDDPAGALGDAEIDGIDEDAWPAAAEAPSRPPRVQDEAPGEADAERPSVLAKARRLFGASDRDDASSAAPDGWDEAAPDGSVPDARGGLEAGDAAAEEFWDEVVPQGTGDVDIDAVIARAQSDEAATAPAPVVSEARMPAAAPVSDTQAPETTAAPAPAADDSALGGLMARLRAGPGEREQRTPRLNLALDAPERDTADALEPQDTRLDSVFARLKSMRRG